MKRSDEIFDFIFNDDLTDVLGLSLWLGHGGRGRGPRIALDGVEVQLTVVDDAVTEVLGTRPGHHGWVESYRFEDADLDGLFGIVVAGQVATPDATGLKLQPFVVAEDGSVTRGDDDDDDSDDDSSGSGSSGGGARGRSADDAPGASSSPGRGADNTAGDDRGAGNRSDDSSDASNRPDSSDRPSHPTGGDDGPGHLLLSVDLDGTTYVVDFKSRPFWADVDLYRDDNGDGTWTRIATFAGPEVADWVDAQAGSVDLTGVIDLLLVSDGLVG